MIIHDAMTGRIPCVTFRAGVRWELCRIKPFKNATLVRVLANRICLNIEWLQTGP